MPADLRGGPAPPETSLAGAVPAPRADAEGLFAPAAAAPPSSSARREPRPTAPPEAVAAAETEAWGLESPAALPRAVTLLAVVPAALVLLAVGDAGGALAPTAWTPGLLPAALLLLPGGPVLVSLVALATLGAAAAGGAVALRRRLGPGTGAAPHRATAAALLLVAPLLGAAVADPVLAAGAGSVVLAGGRCLRAVRQRSGAATRTAVVSVLLVALVLPVQAWWTAVSTATSPTVLPWLVAGSALLVPVVHGRARLVLGATSAAAGALVLVEAMRL